MVGRIQNSDADHTRLDEDKMTTEFGKVDDNDQNNNEGTNFGQTPDGDNLGATENKGLTPQELEALQTRDAAAQAHIPTLESENSELRDEVVRLQGELANATTLDGVLDKISNRSSGTQAIDQTTITQIVDRVLTQKQTQANSDANWNHVQNTLTETFGDWKTADTKVQERALELDIRLADANVMARNNPKAFLQLFNPQTSTNTDRSSGVRSGGSGQTVAGTTTTGNTRDQAFYNKLRRENPKAYWSVETQAQYRRDVHNAT
jgi:hypothetical protein